ncbi:MAG: hypothetical protein ABR543_05595 [Gemmatimonadaceae bacterium]
MLRIISAVVLFWLAAIPPAAAAQLGNFGKNKIHYRDFDWHVISGERVDVYFYPSEEEIARVALGYAEESYRILERRFNHEVTERVPLIVYASHSDFEQTNVLPFVPPEGILGVTEFLKRRVTVPFRGSYSEFRNTIRHEMVHVFQLSFATQQYILYPRARGTGVPLWWSEGLAEFLSSKQDTRDEMIVRDLAVSGGMPTISQLNTTYSPIVYSLGGELHHFLARNYGEWRIWLLHESLWKHSSFNDAVRATYGKPVERLTEEWHFELRQRYYPNAADRRPVTLVGTKIADLALKPVAVSDSGRVQIAYLSPRSGYTNIYIAPLEGPRKSRVLVHGERTAEFESLHEFSSRIDARDGVIIFGSKFGDRDALFFWDIAKNRVTGRYQFTGIVSILSPTWSPDGNRVAFSALSESGVSDIHVFEMESATLTRVTDDRYEDLDPTWLPGGESLVFASDRSTQGASGAINLYRVELQSRQVTALTAGDWRDESPRWDPERQRITFTSDRTGAFDLYAIDSLGSGQRLTQIDGGVFDPAPIPGDSRTVVAAFHDLTWSLFAVPMDTVQGAPVALGVVDSVGTWTWSELSDTRTATAPSKRYRREYSLDFAAGAATSAGVNGGLQGAQLFFSDLLGDHVIAVSVASFQAAGARNLLANFNGNVFYLNQARRINWGVGAFRVAGTFRENDFDQLYDETSVGVFGSVRYPLSRFTRVEGQVSLERSNRNDFFNLLVRGPEQRTGVLTGNYVSLVSDNTLWLNTGPIDGMRWNVTGGVVTDITHGVFENWIGSADVRKYIRTSQQAAVALRGFGFVSRGLRPRAVQISGSWMLRGYPLYSVAGTQAWLANAEWRFPIANFVAFGFPFGVVRFPQLQGAIFTDAGQAWYGGNYDSRVLGSGGLGLRLPLLPGFVLRADIGRRFSFNGRSETPRERDFYKQRFFDIFLGYNY